MLKTNWAQKTPKKYTLGTHRLCDPDETYLSISRHFPTLGITRIADVTGLDCVGIPVCMSVRPNSKSLSVSQGKGMNLPLARVSAAMESIEAYHAENITEGILWASYRDLVRQAEVCDPMELNLHAQSLYHLDLSIQWVQGFDLMTETEVYLPYDLVHCHFLHDPTKKPLFYRSSNGLASGNHILEAISHGICEVIERDGSALWELRNLEPEADNSLLDLDTVDSSACQELLDKLFRAGISVSVWDQTSDVGCPSFGCVIFEGKIDREAVPRNIFAGFGCHLSKEIALSRALVEAAQSRLTYISGSRDDMYRGSYAMLSIQNRFRKWFDQLSNLQPGVDYTNLTSLETPSFEGDVSTQLSLLKKAGFERVIVVDLTRPEIGISVVRVVIPKAEFRMTTAPYKPGVRAKKYMLQIMITEILQGKTS